MRYGTDTPKWGQDYILSRRVVARLAGASESEVQSICKKAETAHNMELKGTDYKTLNTSKGKYTLDNDSQFKSAVEMLTSEDSLKQMAAFSLEDRAAIAKKIYPGIFMTK